MLYSSSLPLRNMPAVLGLWQWRGYSLLAESGRPFCLSRNLCLGGGGTAEKPAYAAFVKEEATWQACQFWDQ